MLSVLRDFKISGSRSLQGETDYFIDQSKAI